MRPGNPCGTGPSLRIVILLGVFLAMSRSASAQFLLPGHAVAGSSADFSAQPAASLPEQPNEAASLSLWTPLQPQSQFKAYAPITTRQRLRWFITNTIGPPHLAEGVFSSAIGTAMDRPKEYGAHWDGFADRYGMRMTGIAPGNVMEAGLGYMIGEDPRYFSARGLPFKQRFVNVFRLTFLAQHDDGSVGLAYARYSAILGNNLLSNCWRASSEANLQDALIRTAGGFASRAAANAFEEFWPSIKLHVFHSGN
jgi:hypothetical protein